jgi:amino acid transporter
VTAVLTFLSVLLLIYCAAAYTLFVVRYQRVTWNKTREGRHLMGQSAVLAAILGATLLFALIDEPRWLGLTVQVALFAWLAFEATRRNHLLTVNQRDVAARARQAYSRTGEGDDIPTIGDPRR